MAAQFRSHVLGLATVGVLLALLTLFCMTVGAIRPAARNYDAVAIVGTDHGIMSIKNNVSSNIMTFICNSDKEKKGPYYATPGGSIQWDFDIHVHMYWSCSVESKAHNGVFTLWKSPLLRSLQPGGPDLCLEVCQWRAQELGMAVLRQSTGKIEVAYPWPR